MWLDQLFFHYSYDSAKLLQAISRICSSTVTLAPLLNKSLITLGETMHLGQVEFVLIEQGQVYARQAYRDMSFRLRIDEFLQIQTMQVSIIVPVDTSAEVKEMLTKAEIGAVVPVIVENSFIGILLVGVKDTGELLNQQDLDTLKIIVPEIAIAMNHAKAVEKIQRFNETLQEGINKATGELRASNVHLQELDRAKDEFISLASHQLSTPLTTVKGYLSMMLDGEAGALTPPQQKFAQRSMDGSERMAHLITDLLNASRMNAGKFKIIRAMTDLGQVVDEEVGQLYQHAKDKGLQLIWNKPATPVMLPFDANKTRQVIMNFIDNAIFYTAAGSITVALDYPSAEHVRVTVKDTGIGVPEAAKSEMFSKFFRAPNAQIARPDGTGLGLYLAKRVVEDQGGTIIFESTEGQGSNFGFTLPLHPAEEPALFTV